MAKAIYLNPTTKEMKLVTVTKENTVAKIIDDTLYNIGYITPTGKVGGFGDDYIWGGENYWNDEEQDFTFIQGYGQQIYRGPLLIIGSDGEGGNADVKMTPEQATQIFHNLKKEYFDEHPEELEKLNGMGFIE
jgi:hypothetical protein